MPCAIIKRRQLPPFAPVSSKVSGSRSSSCVSAASTTLAASSCRGEGRGFEARLGKLARNDFPRSAVDLALEDAHYRNESRSGQAAVARCPAHKGGGAWDSGGAAGPCLAAKPPTTFPNFSAADERLCTPHTSPPTNTPPTPTTPPKYHAPPRPTSGPVWPPAHRDRGTAPGC